MSRKSLKAAVKRQTVNDEKQVRLSMLQSLPRQDHLSRIATSTSLEAAGIWADMLMDLPEEQFKFALNAAHDTLPHNANLHIWGKKESGICPLCLEDTQNLVHILNSCRIAKDLRRYNQRHDAVLRSIYEVIKQHLPLTASASVDLDSAYSFPCHVVATDLRPDIVVWDDSTKEVCLVELSVCYDTLFQDAAQRKESRYCELQASITAAGYRAELITIEVRSQGLPNTVGAARLKAKFGMTTRKAKELMVEAGRQAVSGSFRLWCSRNRTYL